METDPCRTLVTVIRFAAVKCTTAGRPCGGALRFRPPNLVVGGGSVEYGGSDLKNINNTVNNERPEVPVHGR